MKMAPPNLLTLTALALAVAGCSSTPAEEPQTDSIVSSPVEAAPPVEETVTDPAPVDEAPVTLSLDAVYFDYDSYALNSDSRGALESIAQSLNSQPGVRIQIEGHCDERGSNEYNLALGEKRARAVEEYLISMGVDASRLSTISYGEERPAVEGMDESSWSRNRRAEFQSL